MSLADDIGVLRRVPLFTDLTDEQLRLLAFSGERVAVAAGETATAAGDPATGAAVVLSGRLALTPGAGFPGRPQHAGPAALINAPGLVAAGVEPFTVVGEEASELLVIRRPVFLRLLGEFPTVAARLHADLARRLADFAGEAARLGAALDDDR